MNREELEEFIDYKITMYDLKKKIMVIDQV